MLQHQHILWTFLILFPFIKSWEEALIVLIFSVLPDIDVGYKKFQRFPRGIRKFLQLILRIIWNILYLPYAFLLSFFIGKKAFEHRTITHSLIPAFLLSFALAYFWSLKIALLALASYSLHLLFDSITVSGVKWFYPLKGLFIRGRINTGTWQVFLIDALFVIALLIFLNLKTPTWSLLLLFVPLIKEVKLF